MVCVWCIIFWCIDGIIFGFEVFVFYLLYEIRYLVRFCVIFIFKWYVVVLKKIERDLYKIIMVELNLINGEDLLL